LHNACILTWNYKTISALTGSGLLSAGIFFSTADKPPCVLRHWIYSIIFILDIESLITMKITQYIVLKMDESTYKWTFKAGIGIIIAPEQPVSGFTQYFVMNVSFRTRSKAASAWLWSCICNDVRVSKMCL
jgi:hypothetical protein